MQAGSTPTSTDSALLAELALSRGDLVQEWGYDDDVDFTFRDALEDALGLALALAAGSTSRPRRVQATVLRGGAWIGVLERLALFATLLAGFPVGMAAIVAVKAFARYPELKTAQATGAIERFIIGTFASLGWAALCTGVVRVLLRGGS